MSIGIKPAGITPSPRYPQTKDNKLGFGCKYINGVKEKCPPYKEVTKKVINKADELGISFKNRDLKIRYFVDDFTDTNKNIIPKEGDENFIYSHKGLINLLDKTVDSNDENKLKNLFNIMHEQNKFLDDIHK